MVDAHVCCGLLAGGTGSRMQPFVQRWINEERPKQFCSFTDNKTMLEATWERSLILAPEERHFTIITRGQERYLQERPLPGKLIAQPVARGTTTGIAILLAHMLRQSPQAIAVLLPADHFVYPLSQFVERVKETIDWVTKNPLQAVTLAAVPSHPEPEYGWISRQACGQVLDFHEKPGDPLAQQYFEHGYLCNTMITVARADMLWALIAEHAPWVTQALGGLLEKDVPLDPLLAQLTPSDFSTDVVEKTVPNWHCFPLTDVYWSDWGRPERLIETIDSLNINHHLPLDLTQQYRPQVYAH